MTTFRPDTSFPYLALARKLGMHYDYLLYVAGMIESGELWLYHQVPAFCAIADAVEAEKRRRATIIHNALHTGDAP